MNELSSHEDERQSDLHSEANAKSYAFDRCEDALFQSPVDLCCREDDEISWETRQR